MYWLYYVLQTLSLDSVSNDTAVPGLAREEAYQKVIAVPPANEQTAIVAYLDHKNAEIDDFIAKKRQLIALLNEQKAAILNQAITKGLDPNVPKKPCGIEWFGEIPAHWEIVSLNKKWAVLDCKHRTVEFVDEGIPVASIGEVKGMTLDLSSAKKTTYDEYLNLIEGGRKPGIGDIIISRNATVGEVAQVDTNIMFCMGQDVSLIRSKQQNPRFLCYALRSPSVKYQMERLMIGSTFKRLNVSDIKSLMICLPPLQEQDAIVEALDNELAVYYRTITRTEREIELINEFRTTIISDCVTGKIDVTS